MKSLYKVSNATKTNVTISHCYFASKKQRAFVYIFWSEQVFYCFALAKNSKKPARSLKNYL